jgi:hypothetical protein
MKKLYVFCLFIILSLATFAQKLNTDGEPHFDQLVGVKFTKPYYQDGENYDGVYYCTITKKRNDYHIKGKMLLIGIEEIAPINMKLKVYKKIYLQDEWGQLYAYDTKKKTLVLMEFKEDSDVMLYFRKGSKK